MRNGSLPSPTGQNAAAHWVQQRVADDGGRVTGDGSRLLSSESSRRWGGRLVTYGGDARRFLGGSGCRGRVRSLDMSSSGGVLGRWRCHRLSNHTAGTSIPSSVRTICGCLHTSRASSYPGGGGPGVASTPEYGRAPLSGGERWRQRLALGRLGRSRQDVDLQS